MVVCIERCHCVSVQRQAVRRVFKQISAFQEAELRALPRSDETQALVLIHAIVLEKLVELASQRSDE